MGWGELTLLWLCLINDVAADHQGQGAARVPETRGSSSDGRMPHFQDPSWC